jgi:uncharacterized protein YciI
MLYVIYCLDKPDSVELRLANREAHVAHLRRQGAQLVAAGPLLSDDGQTMIGSLIIVDFADKATLEAFVRDDPYAKAGLFQSVSVKPWKKVLP